MKKVEYDIKDMEEKSIVWETRRQKDILDILDEMIEHAEKYGRWSYTFEDDTFFIEYKDGSTYEASSSGEYGTYNKKNIKRIVYVNAFDTQVYGDYEVNEYGNVA